MTESYSTKEFIKQRHSDDREVYAYIEGDLENKPPLGNAAATRLAHFLASDKEVQQISPAECTDFEKGAVGCVQVTLPQNPEEEQWKRVMTRMATRIPESVDFVVLTHHDTVPAFMDHYADIRVIATEIDTKVEWQRVKYNPFSGETYYEPMEGPYA